jgi:UDP-3-O-[3-hydroxymyristoyl] glucosamine N-acyltransferase
VGERSTVAAGAILHNGVYIGNDSSVGAGSELFPSVVVRERVTVGARVILHSGVILGADGFGYRWDGKRHVKLPHVGSVVIEDDVEIGANSCVDRGKFGPTVVGQGTKIDNLVQIGHNVRIGKHCILCGEVGVGGSVVMGNGVILGAKTGVKDNITVSDGVRAAGFSGINSDPGPGKTVGGLPARDIKGWMREMAAVHKLPQVLAEVRALRAEIEALKKQSGQSSGT